MSVPVLDGTASAAGSGSSAVTSGLTTTGAGKVYVAVAYNGAFHAVDSVTGASLTFSQRIATDFGESTNLDLWVADSAGAISGQAITVNFSTSSTYSVIAFGVGNQNGFDANASIPARAAAGSLSVSTSSAETMVLGIFRTNAGPTPATAAANWTLISGDDFLRCFYRTFTSTQSGLAVPEGGNGVGFVDANGLADAVVGAAGGGGGSTVAGRIALLGVGL